MIKSLFAMSVLGTALLQTTSAVEYQTKEYHGFYADDPESQTGLRNPERGFRFMTEVGEVKNLDWHRQLAMFPEVTLTQAYLWLMPYCDQPIPEEKLALVRKDLEELRAAGIKVILRVANERAMPAVAGPTLEQVLAHMDQLAPLFQEYADELFIVQTGFIGAFGEWHTSYHKLDTHPEVYKVVEKLLQILPANRSTTMRVPKYKRNVLGTPALGSYRLLDGKEAYSGTPKSRIGFANDGFGAGADDGGTWPEGPYFGNPGNPEFDMFTLESAWVPVDGELFVIDITAKVDGYWAAERLRLHHYNSLGMFQSHAMIEAPGKEYSIDRWKKQMLDAEKRATGKYPSSANYFSNRDGSPALRSAFEYIHDHLGYRLELQRMCFPSQLKNGEVLSLDGEIINYGFAAPVYDRKVYCVLVDETGAMFNLPLPWDLRMLQPYRPGDASFAPLSHSLHSELILPEYIRPGRYRLGLWMPDASTNLRYDPQYALRLANRDVNYEVLNKRYGINFLGEVEVLPKQPPTLLGHWQTKDTRLQEVSGQTLDMKELQNADGRIAYELATSATFDMAGQQPYTLLARIKPAVEKAGGYLAAKYHGGVAGQFSFALEDGKLYTSREVVPWNLKGKIPLLPGRWYWVAATYNGATLRLYVDGELDGCERFGAVAQQTDVPFIIGAALRNHNPDGFFQGEIDELLVFDRALTKNELQDFIGNTEKK